MRKLIGALSVLAILLSSGCHHGKHHCNSGIVFNSNSIKKVEIYITAENTTDRLTKKHTLVFGSPIEPNEKFVSIIIDPDKQFQTIEGFGGAFTDASAETFYKLPEKEQANIIRNYFSTDAGIGYTLGRTHINSCDFSSDSYSYANASDTALKSFSISHDKKYRIPFIKAALKMANNNIKIFASPWSPPAWMKTNKDMLHGGKLKSEFYHAWANYYIHFVNEYKTAGVPIWGLTVQNEPLAVQTWESCIYTAEEEKDFVKFHLGPALHNAGMKDIKLMVWDHNRDVIYSRVKPAFDDPEAAKYIWGAGFHWYEGDRYDNIRLVHDAYPDKKLLFTEGCVYPFEFDKINEWHWGESYGTSIINDLNNWAVGWTDWNLILDETGGPNHVGNYCYAPVIADTRSGEVHYMNSFYYIGHFSKFIRPGAKRIICSSTSSKLLSTAFLNPDGKLAVVVMNSTDKEINYNVSLLNKAVKTISPAHSIITLMLIP